METTFSSGQKSLPHSATVLVLGILSIVTSCLLVGIVLAIIGLVISAEPNRMYKQNPDLWLGYGNLNAGRIMCIIGTVINGLIILYLVSLFLFFGFMMKSAAEIGNFFNV